MRLRSATSAFPRDRAALKSIRQVSGPSAVSFGAGRAPLFDVDKSTGRRSSGPECLGETSSPRGAATSPRVDRGARTGSRQWDRQPNPASVRLRTRGKDDEAEWASGGGRKEHPHNSSDLDYPSTQPREFETPKVSRRTLRPTIGKVSAARR